MPSPLKMCNCRACRKARRKKGASDFLRCMVRAHRHTTKQKLKEGKEPEPTFTVGWL